MPAGTTGACSNFEVLGTIKHPVNHGAFQVLCTEYSCLHVLHVLPGVTHFPCSRTPLPSTPCNSIAATPKLDALRGDNNDANTIKRTGRTACAALRCCDAMPLAQAIGARGWVQKASRDPALGPRRPSGRGTEQTVQHRHATTLITNQSQARSSSVWCRATYL